jgi:hypothetical protein
MIPDKEMEGYARDCVRFAYLTANPDMRESLLQLAREWMAEATHEEKVPQPSPPRARSTAR